MDTLLKVKVDPNGPLKVEGSFEVELADGTKEIKEKGGYLYRCGHSGKSLSATVCTGKCSFKIDSGSLGICQKRELKPDRFQFPFFIQQYAV